MIERLETRRRRRRLAYCGGMALVIAAAFLLWLPRFSGPIDLRYDAGVYYLLGTSLGSGEGYRIPSEPGAPEGIQYPPLLPALVAAHQWALGTTDPGIVAPWLRFTYAAIFFAYVLAVFTLASRLLGPVLATAATLLCALSVYTYFLSDLLFAEIPFALLSVVFVLVADSGQRTRRSLPREGALFALGTAAFLLRTAGIALLAAWTLEAFVQRRWRTGLARGLLAIVPVALWQAHIARVQRSEEYQQPAYAYQRAPYQYYNVSYGENILLVDPFQPELGRLNAAMLARRVATNLMELPQALGETVSLNYGLWKRAIGRIQNRLTGTYTLSGRLAWVPIFALSVAVIGGMIVLIRGKAWLLTLLVAASLGLVCLTPWPGQFARYLAPLAPFLCIAAVVGVSRGADALRTRGDKWRSRLGRVLLAGLLVFTLGAQAYTVKRLFQLRAEEGAAYTPDDAHPAAHYFYHDRTWRAWEEAVAWIRARAPEDAIVATTSPHLCYLLSGRRSVLPPMEDDPIAARRLLESVPVSYVIVDEMEFLDIARRYALPAVQSAPGRWRLVHSIGATRIYARVHHPNN